MGAKRWVMAALALAWALGVSAQEMRIPFAEKVAITAATGHTEFDAYGRRFSLTLENNSRLLSTLPAAQKAGLSETQLLRGKVVGVPGSWVRLARIGTGLEGAIWDGEDLYVVTSLARVAAQLTLPLAVGPSDSVVYRLSDVEGGLPAQFCGLERGLPRSEVGATSGLQQYKGMVAELRAQAAAVTLSDQITIALISDPQYQSRYGVDTRDTMLARLNTVDGIFSEQVGVLLAPGEVRLATTNDSLNSSDAETLLRSLATYRGANPPVRLAGIAHLMTGKTLNDNIAGIAYLNTLCDAQGVSVSDTYYGEFYGALVMAHELGHNFGAEHDGVPGGICASTPEWYLMAPSVNGSATFSQCSLDSMRSPIQRARGICIVPASYADLAVEMPASPYQVDTSAAFTLPVTVRSIGTLASHHAHLRIDMPSQFTFDSAVLASGTCSAAGTTVDCDLGDVAVGEQRVVELQLRSSVLSTFMVQATVSADSDRIATNNTASVQLGLRSSVDLGVTLASSTSAAYQNDLVDFTIDVRSTRSGTAQGGSASLYAFGFEIVSIDAGGHSCAIDPSQGWQVLCQLADLAGGASTRIVVHARAMQPSSWNVTARVDIANDGDYGNNSSITMVNVTWERQVHVTASTEYLRAVIGVQYDVTFTLTTAGRLPAENVTLQLSQLWQGDVLAVSPSAGTCVTPAPQMPIDCTFGSLNPGDVRTVTVTLRMTSAGSTSLGAFARYNGGLTQFSDYASVNIFSNLRIDVTGWVSSYSLSDEDQVANGSFTVQSAGIDPAQNVVAVLELPAPARITRVNIDSNPGGWQCVLVDDRHARCQGSFPANVSSQYIYVSYDYVSNLAMSGEAVLTVSATDDGDASNNVARYAFVVRPAQDVGIATTQTDIVLTAGQSTAVDFTVTTGRNPVAGVTLYANGSGSFTIESIGIDGVACMLPPGASTPYSQAACPMGDLPANANVPVTIRYHALDTEDSGQTQIGVGASYDGNYGNNSRVLGYVTQRMTDLSMTVARATVTGTSGQQITMPMINVTPGVATGRNVVVNIPLPSFVTIDFVNASNGAICTGTTTLECRFSGVPTWSPATIEIHLNAVGAGSFTSNVTMTASNDTNAANNSVSVAFTVAAASTGGGSNGGGSGSSGGGGGGRLEWLGLLFLGLLLARRLGDNRRGTSCASPAPPTIN